MAEQWFELTHEETLEQVITASHTQPVVLFKHSRTCPISAMAREKLIKAKSEDLLTLPVYEIIVQQSRFISDEVARRWAIKHESPQVLVIYRNRVVYHASHWEIDPLKVQNAVHKENKDLTSISRKAGHDE